MVIVEATNPWPCGCHFRHMIFPLHNALRASANVDCYLRIAIVVQLLLVISQQFPIGKPWNKLRNLRWLLNCLAIAM